MPAAEAIYSPYDFRYIYHQKQMELDSDVFFALKRDKKTGEKESRDRGRQERVTRDAELGDAERIAAFFEKNESPKWAVCTVRDSVYYQTKILEQQSESGGVRLIFEEKDLVGVFFYAREDILEILEPVILQEKRGCIPGGGGRTAKRKGTGEDPGMYGENAGIVGKCPWREDGREASHHGADYASADFPVCDESS